MRGLRVDSFRVLELGVGVVVIGCGDFGAALSLLATTKKTHRRKNKNKPRKKHYP